MAHLKSFITRYSKVYIGLVLLIWLSFFFLPWGSPILGGGGGLTSSAYRKSC
ncbi:SpeK [Streptococcus pneumoniae]|nr:SpeK [Streptococcus pneumoniae]